MFRWFVEGQNENRDRFRDIKTTDLVGWMPPADWEDQVLRQRVDGGVGVGVYLDPDDPVRSLLDFMEKSSTPDSDLPKKKSWTSLCALACLRHGSPLPSFFWRHRTKPPTLAALPKATAVKSKTKKSPRKARRTTTKGKKAAKKPPRKGTKLQ